MKTEEMMDTEERREEFTVDAENAGKRIDVFVTEMAGDITRSFAQKLIESGEVAVRGREKVAKNYKISEGDVILVNIPEPEELEIVPQDIPLNIVYEDADLLVVNKPKGMVVHPAPGNPDGTLVNAIMYHCGDSLSSINGVIRPGIVHRIDKDTSGLLVVAKNDAAHRKLAEQFAVHSITREYRAITYNNFKEDEGTVDAPVGRDSKNRLRMAVTDAEHGRRAVTHYKVLRRSGRFTYIACRLETGRTHQIRVHMAHIMHPLVGDQIYGPKKGVPGIGSQVLHAMLLGFVHPSTGKYVEFTSDLPETFTEAMKKTDLV